MKQLRVTPLDVAMFRDARPFDAEDSGGARLQSMAPLQLTVYGALRNLLLLENNISFAEFRARKTPSDAVGTVKDGGSLRIGPAWMAHEEKEGMTALLPAPADLVKVRRRKGLEQDDFYGYLQPQDGFAGQSNLPAGQMHLMYRPSEDWKITFELEGMGLPGAHLRQYLLGELTDLESMTFWFGVEPRLGIERDAETLVSKEGRLYTAEFVRPRNEAFYLVPVFEDGGELASAPRVISLGGERRPCSFEVDTGEMVIDDTLREIVRQGLVTSFERGRRMFRIYALTPAASSKGWEPVLGEGLEIRAAAVPRAVWLSGWDMANRCPKAARPHIPAGSVYFVEATWECGPEEAAERILKEYWFQPALCERQNSLEAKAGLGITLAGVCNAL